MFHLLKIIFMKFYFLFFVFSLNFVYGQSSFKEAKLFKNDNSAIEGFIKIKSNDSVEEDAFIIYKKDKKSEESILKASEIKQIDVSNKTLVLRHLKKSKYLKYFELVKKGKVSILKNNGRIYLESDDLGLNDISSIDSYGRIEKFYNKGITTKYVSKCKKAHDRVFRESLLNAFELREIVAIFNNCDSYILKDNVPAETAIVNANSNDHSRFKIGLGVGYQVTDYTKLLRVSDLNYKNNSISYNVHASFALSPSFFKEIGFLELGVDYVTQGWSNYVDNESITQIKEKIQYVGLGTDLNFYLYKNENIKSYLGINANLIFNFTEVKVIDDTPYPNLYAEDSFSNLSYGFNLGSDLTIKEKVFNINIQYSPGYKFTVKNSSDIAGTISNEDQQVKTSYLNMTISYYLF